MATLKAIRRRIASVKSTQQITRAMKFVAASRLRRAQDALLGARPYSETLARVAGSLFAGEPALQAAVEGAKPASLLLVIASDRGLCGGYNANVIRKAEEQARRIRAEGLEVRLFAVGRKAVDHFRRTRQPLAGERVDNLKLATVGLANDLAARALADFSRGEVSSVEIVYSQFRSAVSQRPTCERLLPIAPPQTDRGEMAAVTDYLMEPGRAELVPVVLRAYIQSAIFHALLEAEASEYGAKMTAMDSATNNAGDMIGRLTLDMNRARQAGITRELMDIVGGAEALRG